VRFHLDVLCRAGLVRGRPQPRRSAGRPRTVYSNLTDAAPDGYSTLTRLLSAQIGDTPAERSTRAEQAGVQWARELTPEAGLEPAMGAEEAARSVTGLFAELGFGPELIVDDAGQQLRLRSCPFRDVASAHPEVICSIHLGLLRGVLTELGAPHTTSTLRPFVEPELCVVDLSAGQ
jgi:predicted ArsR family transcriptional regulator